MQIVPTFAQTIHRGTSVFDGPEKSGYITEHDIKEVQAKRACSSFPDIHFVAKWIFVGLEKVQTQGLTLLAKVLRRIVFGDDGVVADSGVVSQPVGNQSAQVLDERRNDARVQRYSIEY